MLFLTDLPKGEVQPANFLGTFLYLIVYLESAMHFPPLRWTSSGQALYAILMEPYFGDWLLAPLSWLLFSWLHQQAQSQLPLSLPFACHFPTSVYYVLTSVVDLVT